MSEPFSRNLDALARTNPRAAERLRAAEPARLEWLNTREPGSPSARIHGTDEGAGLLLASAARPATEGEQLARRAEPGRNGLVAVSGFGLGYHVAALQRQAAGNTLLFVYEPDPSLLRPVFERFDWSSLLAADNLLVQIGEPDAAPFTRALEQRAALIAEGVSLLSHPPTRRRRPEQIAAFCRSVTELVSSLRTNLATVLVNAPATCRNLAMNLPDYVSAEGITALEGAATGRPAVLVAAGPSLAKNAHHLAEPGVRDRAVIIAAQTALKPLIDRGVRPHFVTALDYHQISRRFYEDLPDDLPDVTLIADPKVHPTVLDRYPGPVRLTDSAFLDRLLGSDAPKKGALPAGTTVAHLSLYLAQHLGCDPIALVGQDLGFTDGLYYCPGTAIHDVWGPELNAFNTLETMEWKRVARHKGHLQKRTDQRGRTIYTDRQMATYLAQFERDFAEASRTILDATEGGLPKKHTTPLPLAEVLNRHARRPLPDLPRARRRDRSPRLRRAAERIADRVERIGAFAGLCDRTLSLLERMEATAQSEPPADEDFDALDQLRRRAEGFSETMELVNELNQLGTLKRLRADRALGADPHLSAAERQRRQLARDRENVRWLRAGCDETLAILRRAHDRLQQRRGGRRAVAAAAAPGSPHTGDEP